MTFLSPTFVLHHDTTLTLADEPLTHFLIIVRYPFVL